MNSDEVQIFAKNLIAAEFCLDEPFNEGDPAYELLSPSGKKFIDELVAKLMKKIEEYGNQRELAILEKIRDHEADTDDELMAGLSNMITIRIAELKAKEVKGE